MPFAFELQFPIHHSTETTNMAIQAIFTLALAGFAHAHFGIEYPPMRGDTLSSQANTSWSQWTNPCKPNPYVAHVAHCHRQNKRILKLTT